LVAKLNRGGRAKSLDDVEKCGIDGWQIIVVDEVEETASHQLLRFIAEHPPHGIALRKDDSSAIHDGDHI
jgi:hypothetical protein